MLFEHVTENLLGNGEGGGVALQQLTRPHLRGEFFITAKNVSYKKNVKKLSNRSNTDLNNCLINGHNPN